MFRGLIGIDMRLLRISKGIIFSTGIFLITLLLYSCNSNDPLSDNPDDLIDLPGFPAFITPINEYFELQINGDHSIDGTSYKLKIGGAVNNPSEFTLEELRKLEMVEKTLTVECIENPANGKLLGTATWKGFDLYKLLENLGIEDGVTFVKYICSDGYFTYNTIEELREREIVGALYMNDEPIPEKYGFPLRILFPGYYGVRQPGWVVEIELLSSGIRDFWGQTQFEKWNTDSAMAVDSKIFYPTKSDTVILGDKLTIAGAAYGSRRISSVEVTVDDGETWLPATIKQSLDQDYVWVFWEVSFIPQSTGSLKIRARATGEDGRVQPREDLLYLDGTNAWPRASVTVKDAS
jgi:DMSO/TMAO reductase YedYZ molybdopterin-dependent catalytic subunit